MTRPIDWTPLDVGDPAPGDAVRLDKGAKHYAKVAAAIDLASQRLGRITTGLDAQSKAVDALRASAGEVAGDVRRAYERYGGVAKALTDYLPTLREAQEQSTKLLRTAQAAELAEQDARRLAAEAGARAATATPPSAAEWELNEQQRQNALAAEAQAELAAARKSFADLATQVADARRRALKLIRDVLGSGGLKDGWRDNFGGFVNQFVAPILPALNQISAAVGLAALALAWVPFLGPALGTVALALTGLALLANIFMGVGNESGWGPAALSAIGLATFGLSKIAAARYLSQAGGARGAARAAAGRWAAKSPAVRGQKALPTDANSARAISKMMGAGSVQTRDAATRAAATAQGETWRSTSSQVVRNMPRQAWDDLKGIRQFDVRHPLQGARSDVRAIAGERAMAPAQAEVMNVHRVIRESPEVAMFMDRMSRADYAFAAGTLGSVSVWSYETWTLDNPSLSS